MQPETKIKTWLLTLALAGSCLAQSAEVVRFNFNEGTGPTTTDAAHGLVGKLGQQQDPVLDYTQLMSTSPSGLPGDRCITNSGAGFLVADDSATRVLDITNGPITIETWVFIDYNTPAKGAEGLVGYGASYKMGMKGGWQVFTLFGIADITNSLMAVPAGQWVHLAAAWDPGVGVHFFIDGIESFTEITNQVARPTQHNYLSIGSEGLGNSSISALDRVRIHHAQLTAGDLDSVAGTPKGALAGTLVNYSFNEANFPCQSSLTPPLPTQFSSAVLPALSAPVWSSDSPTGLPGDFSLSFLTEKPIIKELVAVDLQSSISDVGANNTNYTLQAWVKLPTAPFENRRLIYRTDGPGPRVSLSINANRAMHTTVYGNTDFASSVFVPNDNRWHHVAAVMEDFARVRFYLDGILRQTMNRTATAVPTGVATPATMSIGKESDTYYFRGLVDRITIHNNALTNYPSAPIDYPAIPGTPTFATLASHPTDVFTNLGAVVRFTVLPTGASGIQWYYRAKLADQSGTLLPGQTSTILTLPAITPQDFGYYYAVVTNNLGAVESYAARLALTPDLDGKLIDFEPPTYVSDLVDGQDSWTVDQNGGNVRVLTAAEIGAALTAGGITPGQTVHGGDQALLINGAGIANTIIRKFTGLETQTNVVVEFYARALPAGSLGTALGNTFLTLENAAGTRAAAVRFGPNFSIDYGSSGAGVWNATGLIADPANWYKITFKLNYTTRQYDFFVDDVQANGAPIPFYVAGSDSFRQIRIYRGASQAGMIMDDLNVPARALRITSASAANGIVTVKWEGGTPPFQLFRQTALNSGIWQAVGSPTNDREATDQMVGDIMFYQVRGN